MPAVKTKLIVALLLALSLSSAPLASADGCVDGIRDTFRRATDPIVQASKRIYDAITSRTKARGRAQSAKVQKILAEAWDEAMKRDPKNPEKAWDEHVKQWEADVLERMSDKSATFYPSVEELLALMAAKSPVAGYKMLHFMANGGTFKFKVLAHFMDRINSDGKIPGEVIGKVSTGDMTFGWRFWEIWNKQIKLPTRKSWTAEEFSFFLTEISNATWRAMHPDPNFWAVWIKNFGEVKISAEGWKLWKPFAEKFLNDYRGKYKEFMTDVTGEAYGKPRPDVIRDFYRWGPADAIYRRLAALKIMLSGQKGSKIIEQSTGLTIQEINALKSGPLWDKLPQNVKNAIIVSKNRAIYNDVLFNAEVEQLSLELMWFVRPVVTGLLHYSTVSAGLTVYEQEMKRRAYEDEIKKNPYKVLPKSQRVDDDRMKNFDEQLTGLGLEARAIEKELAANPNMDAAERSMRERRLKALNRRIGNIQQLKLDLERGIGQVHP